MCYFCLHADLACPFSGKLFKSVLKVLPQYKGRARWVMHQVPQPWHPQSTLMHGT
jgi:hypothetical protein